MIKRKGWEVSNVNWLLMEGTRFVTSEPKTVQQEICHFGNQNCSLGGKNKSEECKAATWTPQLSARGAPARAVGKGQADTDLFLCTSWLPGACVPSVCAHNWV